MEQDYLLCLKSFNAFPHYHKVRERAFQADSMH